MKYLLDTNICIYLFKGKYNLNEQFKRIGLSSCSISEITLAELKYGAELSNRMNENMKMIDEFVNEVRVIPIYNSLNLYAKEKARLKKAGKLTDDFDILIGVSAIANNLILITEKRNILVDFLR